MANLISVLISKTVPGTSPLIHGAFARPSSLDVEGGLAAPTDVVDLATTARSAVTKTDSAVTALASGLTGLSQSSPQTVTFSVTYPGGGSVTSTLSVADFKASLASNDPNALGGESSSDGSSYSVRDILREGTGFTNRSVSSTETSSTSAGTKYKTPENASSSSTDATTATTLLKAIASKSAVGPSQTGQDSSINSTPIARPGDIATTSIAGTQNGVRFSISFSSQPADTAVTGLDIKA